MPRPPIVLKNVRVHNLKGVDLTLEPNQLIVFTGVSGSGKSSLAFDTLYVEGQRRYIDSLSHQARRSLGSLPKPEADSITGIAPTIAIEQKTAGKNPRSTVGTLTGLYDFLRVLFARLAVPHCPVSGEPLAAQSREKIYAEIARFPKEAKLLFLAPWIRGKKGSLQEDLAEAAAQGFTRFRIDGAWVDGSEPLELDPKTAHDADLVIDRLAGGDTSRLKETIALCLGKGKGLFFVHRADTEEEFSFSEHAHAEKSGLSYPPLEPHDFSFNHPKGMCPECRGLGVSSSFNLEKILDPEKSLSEDPCLVGSSYQTVRHGNIYDNLARLYKFSVKTPWKNLSKEAQKVFLYGTEAKWTRMRFVHPEKKTRWDEYVQWRGVLHEAKERWIAAKSDAYRKKMEEWMEEIVCPSCSGSRIRPYPAHARLKGKTIQEISALCLEEALPFFQSLSLSDLERQVGGELLKEIENRLSFLLSVGLGYLSLERGAPTLSGGESQRVRLAAQIGAGLVGAIYVLDEPSIGLHARDNHKLIETLFRLREQGNTVVVVEHDEETILAADTIVEVGPGAGKEGGNILFSGPADALLKHKSSPTAAYLTGKKARPVSRKRKVGSEKLVIHGASHHNLKNVTASIPLHGLICVTGVSGSGKSSLISDILAPALMNHFHHGQAKVGKHRKIEGLEHLDKAISVDQSPIGRTPRSNAATYIKLFDEIRDLFTELPESQIRGFTAGHFSFNVKEGSCSYCQGLGSTKIDMDFMEDVWTSCPQCKGKRFEPDVLEVAYRGKNIGEILDADVDTLLELFEDIPPIRKKLDLLKQVGLGYLSIGQPSTTLSGGEAQRIKLAKELVRPSTGKTLYIFDEPTTGLHFADIERLLAVLQALVDKGNTVLVIEHNLDFLRAADWILDLGPEAGKRGGELLAAGSVAKIARLDTPTGRALRETEMSYKKEKRSASSPLSEITVREATQNTLRGVSLRIPHEKITVLTGPSGSGKSSLAFETLYAEGQRRYTETLSPYARSLVKPLPKPLVSSIEGLCPSIALEQKTGGLNPRSTIGTITEVYDLLRLLFAHLGTAHDPETQEPLEQVTKESILEELLSLPEGEKIQILAPLKLSSKESFPELVQRLNREGFVRIRLGREIHSLDEPISFDKGKKEKLALVVDRLEIHGKNRPRLFESIERAAQKGGGSLLVARSGKEDLFFHLAFANPRTGASYPSLSPQTFSFNHDAGMCPECLGLGQVFGAHLEEIPSVGRWTVIDLLLRFFPDGRSFKTLQIYFSKAGIDGSAKIKELGAEEKKLLFHGGPEIRIRGPLSLRWIGIEPFFKMVARSADPKIKEALLPHLKADNCSACQGARLNPLARNVKIGSHSIVSLCRLSLEKALDALQKFDLKGRPFLAEAHAKAAASLSFLLSLGLGYLSLDRSAPSLSGGELQRIRLARQIGSGLTGCLYVLDEPTIGLHPYNNELLNQALKKLQALGNTLVLVEHDPMTLQIADQIIDFGPKAGKEGGKITASGSLEEILECPDSLTGAYLSGRKKIELPKKRRKPLFFIEVEGANLHNLKNLSFSLPGGIITCFTGVSGSGKSTLVRHLLKPAAEKTVQAKRKKPAEIEVHGTKFRGLDAFESVISVDQSPIGQTSRADVSTYTEIQPLLRSHFASLAGAKTKGLSPGHFSPNHIRGMCRTCWGLGYRNVDLQFLPAVRVVCESCRGHRLNPVSLEVQYKGKHFGEVLQMTVQEALSWFEAIPRLVRKLSLLERVGLSYLCLGQEIASLSGGEAQRLRLSRELSKKTKGKTLYLIDEPTVGLHPEDISRLLPLFHKLADRKNTLILIEHNLDVIASADYLIDLGPDAGEAGGEILAMGTPEEVAKNKASKTALYLGRVVN